MSAERQVDWSKVEPTFRMTQVEGGALTRVEGSLPLSLVATMMKLVAEYNAKRAASKAKRKSGGRRKRSA